MKLFQLKWKIAAWFLTMLTGLIFIETVFTSIFTGYAPTKVSFLLWNHFDILLLDFKEEPLNTLLFILIEKPIFQIESWQNDPAAVIWGLHFYSYTLITHFIVAGIFTHSITQFQTSKTNWKHFPVIGSALLISSSLYLYLSSCCTAGANWIFHTVLLAIFLNPVTATESTLEFYKRIHDGFIWMQIIPALLGIYLIIKKIGAKTNNF